MSQWDTLIVCIGRVERDLGGAVRQACYAQVYLNGQRLPINCFKDYVDLYVKDKEAPRVHERVNDRWEICICASEGQFQQVHRRCL